MVAQVAVPVWVQLPGLLLLWYQWHPIPQEGITADHQNVGMEATSLGLHSSFAQGGGVEMSAEENRTLLAAEEYRQRGVVFFPLLEKPTQNTKGMQRSNV